MDRCMLQLVIAFKAGSVRFENILWCNLWILLARHVVSSCDQSMNSQLYEKTYPWTRKVSSWLLETELFGTLPQRSSFACRLLLTNHGGDHWLQQFCSSKLSNISLERKPARWVFCKSCLPSIGKIINLAGLVKEIVAKFYFPSFHRPWLIRQSRRHLVMDSTWKTDGVFGQICRNWTLSFWRSFPPAYLLSRFISTLLLFLWQF